MSKSLHEDLTRQLCDSVDRLHQEVAKVEFWASAVTGLAAPIPEYDPETTNVARYVKPGRLPRKRKRRRAANQKGEQSERSAQNEQNAGDAKPASA